MKPTILYSLFTSVRLLLVCLILASVTPAWAADYASLIGEAREQLQNERFVEALATAKDAVRANPSDYKGHYYVAMAYMGMDRFDDAEAAVTRSLSHAPESAKPGVEKLASAIKVRRQGTGSLQAADAALADGLAGKAARLYEQAWSAGQDNPELGLKTADLYANRLSQPVDAGRVLRQVKIAAKGSPAADRADAELKKLSGALRQIAQGYVNAARKQQGAEALRNLQLAEDADPSYQDIFGLRARIAAAGNSAEALQHAIKDLARRDLAKPKTLANLPQMAQWMDQPAFNEFLMDMLGSEQTKAVRLMVQNPLLQYEAGQIINDCDTCPEMMVIPSGKFEMGSNIHDSQKPIHSVNVNAFALGKTEVTQGQWRAMMGNNPSGFSSCGDDCPVEQVSWDDAQAYVKWLSNKTGKQYRLPSEAEWEYACRSGGQQEYCGSDNVDSVAWYDGNSGKSTHPVSRKQPNAFGLYDMSGNVWEWVEDSWHDNYNGAPTNGSVWQGDGAQRVLRGGSGDNVPRRARAAGRGRVGPAIRSSGFGFRVARMLP
ncbi:MAG: SUMF1/EgtB/PvdO family nonheme iron enzyme [Candidatus Nitrotoga sp.]|nr:SUMF1/EgtB/PvdO family nonheme iron enzyme [Candidatus Nitrotoga sp.]